MCMLQLTISKHNYSPQLSRPLIGTLFWPVVLSEFWLLMARNMTWDLNADPRIIVSSSLRPIYTPALNLCHSLRVPCA